MRAQWLLLGALLGAACTASVAHSAAVKSQLEGPIDAAALALKDEPRLGGLSDAQRTELVRFVAGNVLFVVLHELGHVLITEMGIPVLGREEDAADAFATITMLSMENEFSARVLTAAARAWVMRDRRDRARGVPVAYYGQHSLDRQRAYQIVCLMVGSNPVSFTGLAQEFAMPRNRRNTCRGDFSNASWSWQKVLEPHRRSDKGTALVVVEYEDGGAEFAAIARALKFIGLIDTVARRASDTFAWKSPFTMRAKACGAAYADWNVKTRTLTVCYELVRDFALLYEKYGDPTMLSRFRAKGWSPHR